MKALAKALGVAPNAILGDMPFYSVTRTVPRTVRGRYHPSTRGAPRELQYGEYRDPDYTVYDPVATETHTQRISAVPIEAHPDLMILARKEDVKEDKSF